MGTGRHDFAIFQHDDLVGRDDGREPVATNSVITLMIARRMMMRPIFGSPSASRNSFLLCFMKTP